MIISRKDRRLSLISLISLILFILILLVVTISTPIFDSIVNGKMTSIQSPLITKIMIMLDFIFKPAGIIFISLLIAAVLFYYKKHEDASIWAISTIIATIADLALEYITKIPRPSNALIAGSGYSFPSGHVLFGFLFFSLLIYSFENKIRNNFNKNLFIAFCIFMVLLISFNRIYLNVHWISDVVGSLFLGIFILSTTIVKSYYISRHFSRKEGNRKEK